MAIKRANPKKPVAYREGGVSLNLPGGRSKKNRCVLCGRTGAEALLNVEGIIHHHGKIRCLDARNCNRKRRKNIRSLSC